MIYSGFVAFLNFGVQRFLYGEDFRQHFRPKLAFAIAAFSALFFLPVFAGDIRTSLGGWRNCLAHHSLSCLVMEDKSDGEAILATPVRGGTTERASMWNIVDQPKIDGRYASDLLITQTNPQLGFACNPSAANIMLIFLTDELRGTVFPGLATPETLRVHFNFVGSGRSVPVELVSGGRTDSGDIVYHTDWRNGDAFQIASIDRVLELALSSGESFRVNIEHGSVRWGSGVYEMEEAPGKWEAANSGRSGSAASNSEICNRLARSS